MTRKNTRNTYNTTGKKPRKKVQISPKNNKGRKPSGQSTPTTGSPRRQPSRRRRSGNRFLHHVLFILVFLVVGIILSLTVFFKIEDVVVLGVEHYPEQDVITESGIELGENLWLVDTKEIEQHLLATFPYMETVRVRRTFPPAIEIHAVPSIAVAALEQDSSNYVLITYDGKILEQGLTLPAWNALLVKGVAINDREPGDILGQWKNLPAVSGESEEETKLRRAKNEAGAEAAEDQKEALRMIQFLYDAMEEASFDNITNIDLTDRYNMKVMYENRMLLKLGSEIDLAYKLEFAKEVLENQLHPDAPGELDLAEARYNRVYYKWPEGYREDGTKLEDPPYTPETSSENKAEIKPTDDAGTGPLPDKLPEQPADPPTQQTEPQQSTDSVESSS